MDATIRARYTEHRTQGQRAVDALAAATQEDRASRYPASVIPALARLSYDSSVSWVQDGFTLNARIESDPDPDYGYIGEFTDTWVYGCVVNPAYHATRCKDMTWRYFHTPQYPFAERLAHFQGLGYARHDVYTLARADVLADLASMRTTESYGVIVTASMLGLELGHDSIWGVDVADSTDPYLQTVALDCAQDAIAEARAKLAALQEAASACSGGR